MSGILSEHVFISKFSSIPFQKRKKNSCKQGCANNLKTWKSVNNLWHLYLQREMKPPKRRRKPPARNFSQPRATKKAKNSQSQRWNEPCNMTTQSDNPNRSNANSNVIQANSSRSMSSIPQYQHSSVDDGPSYHPASKGQNAVPSEGLLPI
jgi:hypothetical protein